MKDNIILAIESTCDETSIALIKNGTQVIDMVTNSQIDFFKEYGGVVPELASRNHITNFNYVLEQIMNNNDLDFNSLDAIAVATKPGLKGSILIGLTAAKMICSIYKIKLIEVNHVHAHLLSAVFNNEYKFPLISLSVSGGHSQISVMNSYLDYQVIGQTKDDSIGEAFDKVSMMLKLGYPGGPYIENLASKSDVVLDLPNITTPRYDFSFSGFKTFINQKYVANIQDFKKEDVANTFQTGAFNHILKKLSNAIVDYKPKQVLVVGGVSVNKNLKQRLGDLEKKYRCEVILPLSEYTTDNAAMIGALAYFKEFNNEA